MESSGAQLDCFLEGCGAPASKRWHPCPLKFESGAKLWQVWSSRDRPLNLECVTLLGLDRFHAWVHGDRSVFTRIEELLDHPSLEVRDAAVMAAPRGN